MRIEDVPFAAIDWSTVPTTEHPGAPGMALWQTVELGNVRIRRVRYSAGYVADHWCRRGHVLLVLDGELVTDLEDGRRVTLSAGQVYCVSNDVAPHRSQASGGATLFIVD